MKNVIPVLLLSSLLFDACTDGVYSSSVSSVDFFADDAEFDTVYVELEKLELDEYPLYPMSCFFAGDNLIVEENFQKQRTDLFKIYNSQKLKFKYGCIGESDDEFKFPFLKDCSGFVDSVFYVDDFDKFVTINLGADGMVIGRDIFHFPNELVPVNQTISFQDSVIAVWLTGESLLTFYDMKSKSKKGFNFYEKPKAVEAVDDYFLNMNLFRCEYGSCGDYIIEVFNNFKMINIISMKGQKLIKRLYFKGYDTNPIVVENGIPMFDSGFRLFFNFVLAQEDCFYVKCWDRSWEEVQKYEMAAPMIYKIDYNGVIDKLFVVDRYIRSFTIKDNVIYAICLDPDEQEWMIYKGNLQ